MGKEEDLFALWRVRELARLEPSPKREQASRRQHNGHMVGEGQGRLQATQSRAKSLSQA